MAGLPQTLWRPASGNGEAVVTGIGFVVDTQGTFLVDTAGVFIVDTGTDFQQIPQTVWSASDGS